MKKLLLMGTLVSIVFVTSTVSAADSCDDAFTAASIAYRHAKKAYKAGDLDDCKRYTSKARSAASDAMSYAGKCECFDAYSSASSADWYAKKAYSSDALDDCNTYAKKTRSAASDAMSYARGCN
jgi:hypothetical protein